MPTISVCMIVKDEEDTLARALECASSIADEIIVVDTGSTDSTVEIAKSFTPHVYFFEWVNDFSAARNFSFSKASMDYCMWLDADDIILPHDIEKLLELKHSMSPYSDIVMLKYNTAFDEHGNPTFSYYRERLIKRDAGFKWGGFIHEAITPSGNIVYNDTAITHKKEKSGDSNRNLEMFETRLEDGYTLTPREQFYFGRELYYHEQYERAIQVFTLFVYEGKGWVENNIDACSCLSLCYRALDQQDEALRILFLSFLYDEPRAEICCDIGALFMEREQYQTAIFWYQLASRKKRDDRSGGFINPDCYDFIPYIQMCVCYDRLGNRDMAYAYNELASNIKPDNESVLYNKNYFNQ